MDEDFDFILEVFSDAYPFQYVRTMHEDMVKKANEGDAAAKKLVQIVKDFAKYCRVAIKVGKGIKND